MMRAAFAILVACLLASHPSQARPGLRVNSNEYGATTHAVGIRQAGWTPTWIVANKLWLESGVGVTVATGASQWNDQSGLGNNVTQATGSKQPTINASDTTFGGLQSMSYLAASLQNLKSGTVNFAQPSTYYVVGQTSIAAGNFIDSGGTTQVTWSQSSNLAMYSGSTISSSTAVSSPRIMGTVFNGASSTGYVSSPTVAVLTGNPGAQVEASVWVGGGGAGPFHTGKIAEVVADVASDGAETRWRMFTFLGNRFHIQVSQ